jgi:SPP1 gp7 family putative phage head morphogenesis protein
MFKESIDFQRALEGDSIEISHKVNAMFEALYLMMMQRKVRPDTIESFVESYMTDAVLPLMYDLGQDTSLEYAPAGATAAQIKEVHRNAIGVQGTNKQARDALVGSTTRLIAGEYARMQSQGMSQSDIANTIAGPDNRYTDAHLTTSMARRVNNNARSTYKTSTSDTMHKTRIEIMQSDRNVIGWRYLAILDSSTTLTCMALHGRAYYFDKSGDRRVPPSHHNCRSTTEPLYREGAKANPEKYGVTEGHNTSHKNIESYLRDNPEYAEEVLTAERFEQWQNGRQIRRFVDYDFKPIPPKRSASN